MQQLLLDLGGAVPPSLDNFRPGRNREAVAAVGRLAATPVGAGAVYLWGAAGAGKSHLLSAAVAAVATGCSAALIDGRHPGAADQIGRAAFGRVPDLVAVDHVEALDAAAQIGAFNVYNACRERDRAFLAAGPVPPAALAARGLRSDLATRLAWGLVLEVHPLDDDEKRDALADYAATRGWNLPVEVADHLLRTCRRDLPSLLAALRAIERRALEQRRAVTLPFARECLPG